MSAHIGTDAVEITLVEHIEGGNICLGGPNEARLVGVLRSIC
jgi:hypothetical protein